MNSIADVRAPEAALAIPRLEDGFANMRELLRQLAESVVNETMSAEADQLCEATREQQERLPGAQPRHGRGHAHPQDPEAARG